MYRLVCILMYTSGRYLHSCPDWLYTVSIASLLTSACFFAVVFVVVVVDFVSNPFSFSVKKTQLEFLKEFCHRIPGWAFVTGWTRTIKIGLTLNVSRVLFCFRFVPFVLCFVILCSVLFRSVCLCCVFRFFCDGSFGRRRRGGGVGGTTKGGGRGEDAGAAQAAGKQHAQIRAAQAGDTRPHAWRSTWTATHVPNTSLCRYVKHILTAMIVARWALPGRLSMHTTYLKRCVGCYVKLSRNKRKTLS